MSMNTFCLLRFLFTGAGSFLCDRLPIHQVQQLSVRESVCGLREKGMCKCLRQRSTLTRVLERHASCNVKQGLFSSRIQARKCSANIGQGAAQGIYVAIAAGRSRIAVFGGNIALRMPFRDIRYPAGSAEVGCNDCAVFRQQEIVRFDVSMSYASSCISWTASII